MRTVITNIVNDTVVAMLRHNLTGSCITQTYYETADELLQRLYAFEGIELEVLDCSNTREMEISVVTKTGHCSGNSVIANISYDDIPFETCKEILAKTHPNQIIEDGE